MIIDRRDALAGMAAMFGASLFAPIARAAAVQVTPISSGPPSSPVFTPPQRALMTALSERVMPTNDTPGAIAAGVPEYIEKLLADWASPDDRQPLDRKSGVEGKRGAVPEDPGGRRYMKKKKQLIDT